MDSSELAADPASAGRVVYWNIGSTPGSAALNITVMYVLLALAATVAGYGFYRRIVLWSAGRPDPERLGDWNARCHALWRDVFGQARVNRDEQSRAFHPAIVAGFVVLLFTTTMVFLSSDLGLHAFYSGRYYLMVTALSDLFGIVLCIGLARAGFRRYIVHPDRLHNTPADAILLCALLLLVIQGFLLEALRIHATHDPWRHFSFAGYALSLMLWPLSDNATRALHFAVWWFHTATVFACIAVVPYTKLFHIIASSANLFFAELRRPKGALRNPGDIEQIIERAAESGDDFQIGVATLADLTWKQRLDLDSCTSCGRCQEVCPAYNSGKPLSPKWLILDARDHMLALAARSADAADNALDRLDRSLLAGMLRRQSASLGGEQNTRRTDRARNELVQGSARRVGEDPAEKLAGGVMEEDVFWSCTTCRACVTACPVGIEHVDLITDVRRSLALMDGSIPSEAQGSLRAIDTRGNPFGPAEARADWAEGLSVRIIGAGQTVDTLYWVGCVSSFDKRKQKIARSMARILTAAGLDWGILGNREQCTGDPARRLGEENVFQCSAKKNIETLRSISYKTIVTNCPHCMNTLRNEYPSFGDVMKGGDARVVHHSELIRELLATGRLALARELPESLTYHDPCYLGRYNDTYREPREILVQLGGAGRLREMEESGERGMCCGAGGGHFWMDLKIGSRVNVRRADQVAATEAERVATACPFCLQMLEDGMKLTDREQRIAVRDLAELVAEAMEPAAQPLP